MNNILRSFLLIAALLGWSAPPALANTINATLTALNQAATIQLSGSRAISVTVSANTNVVLTPYVCSTAGYCSAVFAYPANGGAPVATISAAGQWVIPSESFQSIKLVATTVGATPSATLTINSDLGAVDQALLQAIQTAQSGIVSTAPETGVNGQQLSLALHPNGALREERSYKITPIVSTAAEASHQICTLACEFVSVDVTTGGTAGFLLLFNSATAPADGAVTPTACVPVAANSLTSYSVSGEPTTYYDTGLTVVFSTTGCFTKTGSATAFFVGKVQ